MVENYFKTLRPHQWLKNLMLFFPPFLDGSLLGNDQIVSGVVSFASFCLASSSSYIINDLYDRERDAHHPKKRTRPIASGAVTPAVAGVMAFLLLAVSLFTAWWVSVTFVVYITVYLLLSFIYSVKLKNIPLVDIFCISAGFLIRLEAGGLVFGIAVSRWLFLSVFLLALFLAIGKRLHEKDALGESASGHRMVLVAYPDGFLEGAMFLTGATVLVTYTMYVISRHTLVYSVPLCCFGLLRYIFRVQSGCSGDPTDSLLTDRFLLVTSLLWAIMMGVGIYGGR